MTRPLEHILRGIRAEEAKISFHKTRLDRFKAELRDLKSLMKAVA